MYKLFLIAQHGPDTMLRNQLKREGLEIQWCDFYDGEESKILYKKYKIKSTPVLLKLDNGEVCDRIFGVSDIIRELKKELENAEDT